MKFRAPNVRLVVEKLDFLTLPYVAWLSFRYNGGYYIYWGSSLNWAVIRKGVAWVLNLHQVRYEDVPGSYFTIQRIVAKFANDALCEHAVEAAPIFQFLQTIQNHRLMPVALRKVLSETYTLKRIKAFTLTQSLMLDPSRRIVYLPADNRMITDWVPEELHSFAKSVQPPKGIYFLNEIRSRLDIVSAMIYTILCVPFLIAQRGLCLAFPPIRRWSVGYDIHNWGIYWDKPYHGAFIYGKEGFAPQNILHVVRNRLTDERVRQCYERHGIPYIEASRLPIPIAYLGQRVIGQMVGGFLVLCSRLIVSGRAAPFLCAASELLMHNLIRAEILDFTAQTDVFVARDEYGVVHILRTLLYDKRGGKTIGFVHGDSLFCEPCVSYLCFHSLCLQGEFVQQLLQQNAKYSDKKSIIGAGIYGLDRTFHYQRRGHIPGKYKELKKKYRLIGVFGSVFLEDFYLTREMALRFYKTALSLLQKYPDVMLVIRPKTEEFEDPDFRALIQNAGPRVILETGLWSYKLLPVLDLMICINISTIGLEGLMAGRRVLYMDESGFRENPYDTYGVRIVTHSPDELFERVDDVLVRNDYADPATLEHIRRSHGFQFDGQVGERMRHAIAELLASARPEQRQSAGGPV